MTHLLEEHIIYLHNGSESYLNHCESEADTNNLQWKTFWWVIGSIYVLCDILVIILSTIYFRRSCKQFCKFKEIHNYMEYNYEPSKIAKVLALIVPIIFLSAGVLWAILEIQYVYCIMPWKLWKKLELIPAILGNIVYYFYYWFLTSMLKSYMEKEPLFKHMIPNWLFIAIRVLVAFNFIVFAVKTYIHYITDGQKYFEGTYICYIY